MADSDDLRQIASQIQKDKAKGITSKELEEFSRKLLNAQSKNQVDPRQLASSIAKSTAAAVSHSLPSPSDFIGALVSANPLLSAGKTIFNKLSSSVSGVLSDSQNSRKGEIDKLLQTVEDLKAQVNPDEGEKATDGSSNDTIKLLQEQADTLKKILNELTDVYKLQEEKDAEEALNRLKGLDVDPAAKEKGLDLSGTDKLLGKMIANQERSFMLDALGTVKGVFGSILSGLSGLLGGLMGGGLLATLAKGAMVALKVTGIVGLVVGGIYQLYEGFTGAADFFGKESVSLFDKIRYAGVHLISALVSPIDWAVEFITGKESNLREKFERGVIALQDMILDFLTPISDGFGWLKTKVMEVFEGINLDTKLVDIPEIIADNIRDMIIGAWNNLMSLDIPGKVKAKIDGYINSMSEFGAEAADKFNEGIDFAKELKDSVLESIRNFFMTTFDSFLEYMASELEEAGLFGIGGKAAESLRSLKSENQVDGVSGPDKKDIGVGVNGFQNYNEATQSQAGRDAQRASVVQSPAPQQYHPSAPPQGANTSVYAPVNNTSSTTVISSGMTTRPARELVPDF